MAKRKWSIKGKCVIWKDDIILCSGNVKLYRANCAQYAEKRKRVRPARRRKL